MQFLIVCLRRISLLFWSANPNLHKCFIRELVLLLSLDMLSGQTCSSSKSPRPAYTYQDHEFSHQTLVCWNPTSQKALSKMSQLVTAERWSQSTAELRSFWSLQLETPCPSVWCHGHPWSVPVGIECLTRSLLTLHVSQCGATGLAGPFNPMRVLGKCMKCMELWR